MSLNQPSGVTTTESMRGNKGTRCGDCGLRTRVLYKRADTRLVCGDCIDLKYQFIRVLEG